MLMTLNGTYRMLHTQFFKHIHRDIYIDQTMGSNARFVSLEKKVLGVSAFTDT